REEELFHGDPYDVYYPVGWMKRHLEVLARMYSEKLKRRMCVQVIRPSNIYGPFDDFRWKTSHVLAALIRKVIERHEPIEVWGTGNDVRDVIYIDDFAEACLDILEKSETYDPVNVALGKGYRVKEMLEVLCEEDGYVAPRIVFNPAKPSMIPVRRVSVEKAERVFGFRAKTDLREGVRKTMRWYRENGEILRRRGIPGDERA
ncbi:MAG TPA: NAD-dependent epimerase/dehydratase family protein, partial [Elusimicrobiota bacterium]|nr:NAD-dependent epimerase/dehydratase family protein [Elusimicrobiota bacterium]